MEGDNNTKQKNSFGEMNEKVLELFENDPEKAIEFCEKYLKEYPNKYNVQSTFTLLRLKALIKLERFDEVIKDGNELISKLIDFFPKLACDIEIQVIKAMCAKAEDNLKHEVALEEINRALKKFPRKQCIRLERRKLKVLILLGMNKNQYRNKAVKLGRKYHVSHTAFIDNEYFSPYDPNNNKIDYVFGLTMKEKETEQLEEDEFEEQKSSNQNREFNHGKKQKTKKQVSNIDGYKLGEILELEDDSFDEYIKDLGQKEKIYLLIARYKIQKRDKMVDGAIKEYSKRYGESEDPQFLKALKQISLKKKGAFDILECAKTANNFGLSFPTYKKDIADSSPEI